MLSICKKESFNLFIAFLIISLLANCSDSSEGDNSLNSPLKISARTYGGSNNDSALSVTNTLDGGYAILGFTQSPDGNVQDKSDDSFDFWLLKFDGENQLQWQKIYGGSLDDKGSDLIQTSDGGYAIFGSSQSSDADITANAGNYDFWVAKLNGSGNIIWQKSFGYSGLEKATSLVSTKDGGFLLIGELDVTASGGEGNSKLTSLKRHAGGDYWIIKLDKTGNKQWSKYFGGTFTDTPYNAVQTDDNGYIIVGSSDSNDLDISLNKGSYDFWIIKISETGILEWEKSFGGSEIDEAWGIEHSGDGNYLIIGDTRSRDQQVSFNNGAADIWIIKINPQGELLWEKTIGGSSFDAGRSISKTQNGNFIIAGNSRSSDGSLTVNKGQNDAWILKMDSEANILWQKSVGGAMIDLIFEVVQISNGHVVAVGETSSSDRDILENKGFTDLLIINIDE